MLTKIRVTFEPLTDGHRLYPHYDEEADLLEVGRRQLESCPYGANLDSTVIFDCDAQRILVDFEVIARRRRWSVTPGLSWRPPTQSAALRFSEESVEQHDFIREETVETTPDRSLVRITFGAAREGAEVIALSEVCSAFVADGELCGFQVRLDEHENGAGGSARRFL